MNLSTERINLIKGLNVLKADMQNAKTVDDFRAVREQMIALKTEAKGTPYEKDMEDLFGGAIVAMDHPDADQNPADCVNADKTTVAGLKESIDAETDNLGKIDSLELVQIQQLVSDAKETSQLASNLFSSRDQTANSIVGNIRG
jgi:predicted ATP-binding protein involved in virulence